MAQHDYVIANGTGAAVRSDLNNGLAAIVSQNSGATAPATTYAYMTWADTTAGVMKMRNGANNAWITLYQLDGEWSTIAFENGTAAAPSIYFKDSGTDTGIYSPGTDQVAISTGGTGRLFVSSAGLVGIGVSAPQEIIHASGNIRLTNGAGFSTANSTVAKIGAFAGSANQFDLAQINFLTQSFSNMGQISFSTSSASTGLLTEAIRIDSSQRVGIGTASPTATLELSGTGTVFKANTLTTTSTAISLQLGGYVTTSNSGCFIKSHINHSSTLNSQLSFEVNGGALEAARIDSSGRILVGTSSAPTTGLYAQFALLTVKGYAGAAGGNGIINIACGSPAASIGSGGDIGTLVFSESSGGEYARIGCFTEGTGATGDYPGRLVFSTTADGAASPTERFRISNDGSFSSVIPGGSTLYPRFGCRAWVNFNGTGTVAIRGSGNVSSITDNGTGDYTVNFTTAMVDANYCVSATANLTVSSLDAYPANPITLTASAFRFDHREGGSAGTDSNIVSVAIFR